MKIHKVVAEHAVTAGLVAVAVVEMDDIRRWAYEVRSAGGELVQDEALLKAATLPGVGANLYRSTVAARWEYDCLSLTFRWRDPSGDAAERAQQIATCIRERLEAIRAAVSAHRTTGEST